MSFGSYPVGSVAYGGEIRTGTPVVIPFIPKKQGAISQEEQDALILSSTRFPPKLQTVLAFTPPPERGVYADADAEPMPTALPRLVTAYRAPFTPYERPATTDEPTDTPPLGRALFPIRWFLQVYTPARRALGVDEPDTEAPGTRKLFPYTPSAMVPRKPTIAQEEQDGTTPARPTYPILWFLQVYTPLRRILGLDEPVEPGVPTPPRVPPTPSAMLPLRRPIDSIDEDILVPSVAPRFIAKVVAPVSIPPPERPLAVDEDAPVMQPAPVRTVPKPPVVAAFTQFRRALGLEEQAEVGTPTAPHAIPPKPTVVFVPPPERPNYADEDVIAGTPTAPRTLPRPPAAQYAMLPLRRPAGNEDEVVAAQPVRGGPLNWVLRVLLPQRRTVNTEEETPAQIPVALRVVPKLAPVVFVPPPKKAVPQDEETITQPTATARVVAKPPVVVFVPPPEKVPGIEDDTIAPATTARHVVPAPAAVTPPLVLRRRVQGVDESLDDVSLVRKVVTYARALIPTRKRAGEDATEEPTLINRPNTLAWLLRAFARTMWGRARVANTATEGYVVYVGYGQMPDFTALAGYSATLPVAFAITPPLSGTVTLWVVTRRRDLFGIESQNTQPQYITIDSSGNEVLGPLTTPSIISVLPIDNDFFSVQAAYPGLATDANPADTWRVYVGVGAPPVPGVDVPAATGAINVQNAVANIGPYPTGGVVYYFAVTVYRTQDALESAAGTFVLTLPVDPVEPQATPGGPIADNEV